MLPQERVGCRGSAHPILGGQEHGLRKPCMPVSVLCGHVKASHCHPLGLTTPLRKIRELDKTVTRSLLAVVALILLDPGHPGCSSGLSEISSKLSPVQSWEQSIWVCCCGDGVSWSLFLAKAVLGICDEAGAQNRAQNLHHSEPKAIGGPVHPLNPCRAKEARFPDLGSWTSDP